jgi:hypothetical protein
MRKQLIDGNLSDLNQPPHSPDLACAVPTWERGPIRVTFELTGSSKETFVVRGRVVDLMTAEHDYEPEDKPSCRRRDTSHQKLRRSTALARAVNLFRSCP